MFKRMILASATFLAVAGYGADGITINNSSRAQTEKKPEVVSRKTTEQEKTAKIAELNSKRIDLIRKLHRKRQDLLKNNPKLRRMYQQLLKQTREIALELDANREMRQLNDALADVERRLKNELESKPEQPASKPKK